jgi:hypothetical protein
VKTNLLPECSGISLSGRPLPEWYPPIFGYHTFFPIHFSQKLSRKNVWRKSDITQMLVDSTFGRPLQKWYPPTFGYLTFSPPFSHTFFPKTKSKKCMGKKVGYPNVGGCHFGSTLPKVISPNIRVVALFSLHLTSTVGNRITWCSR